AFKPKYKTGYFGIGYNILLGGGWLGAERLVRSYWTLSDPSKVVVFATAAQLNDFQLPATPKNPMLEEFYGIDTAELTIHYRHKTHAIVGFANGSAGFMPVDSSTLDPRDPEALVGKFPAHSEDYRLE